MKKLIFGFVSFFCITNVFAATKEAYISGFGVTRYLSTETSQTGAGFRPRLAYDPGLALTFLHDMAIKQEFIVVHGYGQFGFRRGTAEYSFDPTDGGLGSGSGVRFNAAIFEFGMGPRYRPFPSSIFTPVFGVGGHVGATRIRYNDPSFSSKVTGAAPFSKINGLFTAGFYVEGAVDIRVPGGVGIEVIAKRKFTRTNKARTLNHEYLNFWSNEITAALVLPF